jgi:L-iditol 2-dehydrogenase
MKALLLSEYSRLELVDFPDPEVDDHTVLVRVGACGICGSDVHGFDGSTGRRIPPLVMGHEAAGIVERVGSAVTRFAPGDRVTFDSTIYCGTCAFCRRGEVNLCDNRQVLGVSCGEYRRHGAFAELVAVPEHIVYALPESLPLEHAALIEAVSVAVHAVVRSEAGEGTRALVVGTGMIGLLVVQVLRSVGADPIVAVDIDDHRLELARTMGATHAINSRTEGSIEALATIAGHGVDAAFEVVGHTETIATAIAATRKGGSITLVGNLSPKVELPLQAIVTRELTLYGSCASQGDYPLAIELMASGKVDVAPLLSAVIPLEDAPAWFERLHAREAGLMKVVVKP